MTPSDPTSVVCPFLALQADSQTRYTVPDEQHACHRAEPAQFVDLEYQGRYCLASTHRECPGYFAGWRHGLPRGVRRRNYFGFSGLRSVLRLVVALAALASLGFLVFQARGAGPGTIQTLAVATREPSPTPTATARLIATLRPSLTLTPKTDTSPTPNVVYTPTAGPLVETPFGPESRWLVHVVNPGESLDLIAQQYGTTSEVLAAVNKLFEGGLWSKTPLVICVSCVSAEGLPRLVPVWLEQRITLTDLAAQYNTAPADLRTWNNIEGDWVEAGRWVVVNGNQ